MNFGEAITSVGQTLKNQGQQLAVSTFRNAKQQAINEARNAARKAIDKGLSYVPGSLRGAANTLVNDLINGSPLGSILDGSLLGGGVSGCDGGAMYSEPEDFNQLRLINKKLVSTEFVLEWNFRLEIEDQPEDFDLYIKDISYSGFETSADEERYGSATYSWPMSDQPLRISFTARDNADLRIAMFLHDWQNMTINANGTVNVPFGINGYAKKARVYHIKSSGEEIPLYQIMAYPTQFGECSRSHENGAFMEMPVTLTVFSTLYCS